MLVSHDGARWLPTVLEGLAGQLAPIAHSVAVDTGSKDGSPDLLADAFGADCVVALPPSTSFPAALRAGLAHLDQLGADTEWVWVLHDDASPHPEALLALLAGAADDPDADVLGPMLREWPSLKRLLELGVTISGTGRRETGLERGEYDQGQYSEPRTVLAVNTAGMLVRRRVLDELGGLDDQLPIFGNDLDFGWRAAAAGHRTVAVPQAVVFHAEAAHRGLRRTPLTGRHTHYQERRAALFTLLANSRSRVLPLQAASGSAFGTSRSGCSASWRSASPGQALDDLAAYVSVRLDPARAAGAPGGPGALRPAADPATAQGLLAPRWLPYRHGLDAVSDLATALTQSASDVAERRRAAAAERDPSSFAARRTTEREQLEDDEVVEDTGLVARFLTNPVAVLLAVTVLAMLVGARSALGHVVRPGALARAQRLERLVVAAPLVLARARARHRGARAAVRAADGVAVHRPGRQPRPPRCRRCWCLLSRSRCGGRGGSCAWPAGSPRPAGATRWLILWGATTYAVVPVVSGAWGQGSLARCCPPPCCPGSAHAALGFADPEADRRWRAAWRTGLLLALVSCGTPLAWLVAALVGVVVVLLAFTLLPGVGRDRSAWGPPLVALAVVPVLLAPWWLPALLHGAGEGLLLDGGLLPVPTPDGVDLGLGRFHDLGAPWWLGWCCRCWRHSHWCPAGPGSPCSSAGWSRCSRSSRPSGSGRSRSTWPRCPTPPGLGFLLVVLQAALVTAVVLGALGLRPAARCAPSRGGAGRRRRRRGAAGRAGLVRARGRRPPDRRPGRRHPGVHGAELGARPGARDPRGPRLGGGRADLHGAP